MSDTYTGKVGLEIELRVRVSSSESDDVRDVVLVSSSVELAFGNVEGGVRRPDRAIGKHVAGLFESGLEKVSLSLRGPLKFDLPTSPVGTLWHPNMPEQELVGPGEVLRGRGDFEPNLQWARVHQGGPLWIRCARCSSAFPAPNHVVLERESSSTSSAFASGARICSEARIYPSVVCPRPGCGAHYWATLRAFGIADGTCPTCAHGQHEGRCTVTTQHAQLCGCNHDELVAVARKAVRRG